MIREEWKKLAGEHSECHVFIEFASENYELFAEHVLEKVAPPRTMAHYRFFEAQCKTMNIKQKDVDALLDHISENEYYIGEERETLTAHCVWCARSEVIMKGLIKQKQR